MSTIVCQSRVSRYDSRPRELTATLVLKPPGSMEDLPPPPAPPSLLDNWGGSLDHPSYSKPAPLSLGPLSLDLCTENLGSETGSEMSSPPYSPRALDLERGARLHRRANRGPPPIYPPPLITMSGASTLQVRRRREEGRLIIDAVEAPFRNAYLQAERSDGRLRLSFPGTAQEEEEEEFDGETEEIDLMNSRRCNDGGCGRDRIPHNTAWESRHHWVVTS